MDRKRIRYRFCSGEKDLNEKNFTFFVVRGMALKGSIFLRMLKQEEIRKRGKSDSRSLAL